MFTHEAVDKHKARDLARTFRWRKLCPAEPDTPSWSTAVSISPTAGSTLQPMSAEGNRGYSTPFSSSSARALAAASRSCRWRRTYWVRPLRPPISCRYLHTVRGHLTMPFSAARASASYTSFQVRLRFSNQFSARRTACRRATFPNGFPRTSRGTFSQSHRPAGPDQKKHLCLLW